jgi:hypothetical protein
VASEHSAPMPERVVASLLSQVTQSFVFMPKENESKSAEQ